MTDSIKSEFRKLLTVRSTYAILLIDFVIGALFAGYGSGFKGAIAELHGSALLATQSYAAIAFGGFIVALIGLLMFGNEYRYGSIMYTLTSSNSRLKSLFAKFIVISVFAVVVSVILALFAPLCAIVGAQLAGKTISPQHFDYWQILWKCALCGWGYAMYAFVIVAIFRNQIGAIVGFLLIPLVGESLVGGIFKSTGPYLPFTSLQSIVMPSASMVPSSLTHNITVSLSYIVSGLLIATVLFVRRDAN